MTVSSSPQRPADRPASRRPAWAVQGGSVLRVPEAGYVAQTAVARTAVAQTVRGTSTLLVPAARAEVSRRAI